MKRQWDKLKRFTRPTIRNAENACIVAQNLKYHQRSAAICTTQENADHVNLHQTALPL